jgi:hypothetical protein
LGETGKQIAASTNVSEALPDSKGNSSMSRTGTIHREKAIPTMKKTKSSPRNGNSADSQEIDARIKSLGDWRGEMLSRIRTLIKQADPDIIEEIKWRKPSNAMSGVPVWSHGGIICTGETYKAVVKMTFARGAALPDPSRLFNASLDGNTRRAIDLHEGDKIDEKALKSLIRAAVEMNTSASAARTRKNSKSAKES